MITAPQGVAVEVRHAGGKYTAEPVVAFDDDGRALYAGDDGVLTSEGVIRLSTLPPHLAVLSLTPAPNWYAEWRKGETLPLVGFAVCADNFVRPVIAMNDGTIEVLEVGRS